MRSKTTSYVCDICSNTQKVEGNKIPIDWIQIVRKKKKCDICVDCKKAIEVAMLKLTDEPF